MFSEVQLEFYKAHFINHAGRLDHRRLGRLFVFVNCVISGDCYAEMFLPYANRDRGKYNKITTEQFKSRLSAIQDFCIAAKSRMLLMPAVSSWGDTLCQDFWGNSHLPVPLGGTSWLCRGLGTKVLLDPKAIETALLLSMLIWDAKQIYGDGAISMLFKKENVLPTVTPKMAVSKIANTTPAKIVVKTSVPKKINRLRAFD